MNPKHTLGFLAGGYRNVAALKGIELPDLAERPLYDSMLIGWDAADWNSMYPLLQQGKMPALAELLSAGVHANLATLDRPSLRCFGRRSPPLRGHRRTEFMDLQKCTRVLFAPLRLVHPNAYLL